MGTWTHGHKGTRAGEDFMGPLFVSVILNETQCSEESSLFTLKTLRNDKCQLLLNAILGYNRDNNYME